MAPDLRKHRLGWIGLGRMGYAMAERLAKANADVRGYNRTRAKAEALSASGVALVDRPLDLAQCDIVFTMVSTSDDLKSVLVGKDGLFARLDRNPSILVELSTISTEASAEIRERGHEARLSAPAQLDGSSNSFPDVRRPARSSCARRTSESP